MTATFEETVQGHVEEMKAEETFDLAEAVSGTKYPTDDCTVFTDGQAAHELNVLLQEVHNLGIDSANRKAASTAMVGDPEADAIDAKIEELQERQKELIAQIRDSSLTFHLRGIAPKLSEAIVNSWQAKIKPASKSEEDMIEAQNAQNNKINAEVVAKSIVKVVNGKGQVSRAAVSVERAEQFRGDLPTGEWEKLLTAANALSYARNMFSNVIAADADFLSKS